MIPLPKTLKDAAEDAFHNNALLAAISLQDREQAAQWYENVAAQTGGSLAKLAWLYNLERVKFLRGQVTRITRNAPTFADEIGYFQGGKP
jgi:hypothetical protein